MSALWERPDFRRAAGDAWRPGGVELTERALEWCAACGALQPGALVVDFGCGAGASLRLLEQRGYRAVGLDKNAAGAPPADARAAEPCCRLVRADLVSPPLAASCCDGVLCECVLSLLKNPLAALGAAFRALRPGGVLVVSDLLLRPGYAPAAASLGPHSGQEVPVGSSCLAGAKPEPLWRGLIAAAGFELLHYGDKSRALVELAARMIWYGDDARQPAGACACGGAASGLPWRAYGYGLWIARKEAL